jgi:sialate O-acetylesterase
MEMPIKGYRNQPVEGSNMAIVKSKNDNIRLFTVPHFSKIELQDTMMRATQWKISEPEAVANFSATGYFFGKMLYEMLDIPVGLIVSSWGGSQVESWMREDMLADFPEISIPKTESDIKEPNRTPTTLFSGMINPILGYEIRGCIWYQGESNYERPDQYELLFQNMVKEWRKAWGIGEFPFYFAQIAPYNYAQLPPYNKGGKFNSAFLRDAQRKSELRIPNSAMVVLIDIGEESCIHPKRKKEVGERFALQALARAYGLRGFAHASPTFNEINISNDTVQVLFGNGKLGLTTFGEELTAFEIAGEDRKFYPAKAQIKYKNGAMVELTSPAIAKPAAVRYAFQDFIIGNLYSTEGLPVPSFRTDNWDE